MGGELWRPRRRAMSCSSSRRSSRSLVGLLSAARPASFIESYPNRNPTNPSSPLVHRSARSEHVLTDSTRPVSCIDSHSTSTSQDRSLYCRAAASEYLLPGATGDITPEEFHCNKNNPVSSMKHLPSTVCHLLQHSTFCSTNITVISEHPSEVRNGKNLPRLSASTAGSGIKSNSSSTDNTRNMLQIKHQNNDSRNANHGTDAEAEDSSRRAETDLHGSSQFSLSKISSNSTTVMNITDNPTTSHNTSTVYCSVEPDILNGYMSHMTDHLKDQNKSSHKKSDFVTYSQYSPVISGEYDAGHLKDSTNPIQSNVAHSTLTTNGENSKGNTVTELKEQRSRSENISAKHVSCNEFSVTTVKSPEYSISAILKGPIQNKDENSLDHNLVHSTNFTCSVPDTEAEYSPQYIAATTVNIQNQEPYSSDTSLDQAATDYNASKINNQTQK